jgi:hypothetical protein
MEPGGKEEIVRAGAAGWIEFRKEFETGKDSWWLGAMRFRLVGAGTAWIAGLSLREAGGGPELLPDADPDRPVPGTYDERDCAMLDRLVETAEAKGVRLQLCAITRDLYMGSLKDPASPAYSRAIDDARKLFRYCAARWGASTAVAAWEHFNELDPGLPVERFYAEVGEGLRRADVHGHLRATSAWAPSPRDWALPSLDTADLHYYYRPSEGKRLPDEVTALLDRARFLREKAPSRPALLSEFGLADEKWGLSPEMARDAKLVHFHDALWASALSGLSGTALFWWWEELDRRDAYGHYAPVARFVEGIPFAAAGLERLEGSVAGGDFILAGLRGRDRAWAWILDRRAAWTYGDGSGPAGAKEPGGVKDAAIELRGLDEGAYRLEWWDPWEGKASGEGRAAAAGESLRAPVPAFGRDIAVKVLR